VFLFFGGAGVSVGEMLQRFEGEAMCRSGYQYLYLDFLGDYAGLVLIDWSGVVGSMDSLPRQVDSSSSLISEF
jgi:hypothetical protein